MSHSRFRDSVNCGAPSMEKRFQVAKNSFEVQKDSSLFCLVQNIPGVTWVACIDLKVVLRVCKCLFRGLFGPFVTLATHSHSELRAWNSKKMMVNG